MFWRVEEIVDQLANEKNGDAQLGTLTVFASM
jgi:hypothetical protein